MRCRWAKKYIALAACLCLLAGCETRVQQAPSDTLEDESALETEPPEEVDNSFEAIAANIALKRWDALAVTSPAEDIEIGAEAYYITGVSMPGDELLLNGEPVEHRGALGSFGVYAELEEGANTFTFTNGDETQTVVITRNSALPPATTKSVREMRPEFDVATRAGVPYTLACVAPAGAVVTAVVGGDTVALEQTAATDYEGIPAAFSAELIPEEVDGTVDLGTVAYTLEYGGETSEFTSAGSLFVVGGDDELVVRGIDVASAVFTESDDESEFHSTLPMDAVDVVTEIGGSMYRLGMGGWVFKKAVEPLTEPKAYENKVSAVRHEAYDSWETIILTGSAASPYSANWGDGAYEITLYHTSGIEEIPLRDSALLAGIDVADSEDGTVLTFHPLEGAELWGFMVDYVGGETRITVKRKPALGDGDKPLAGVTIALDPGHGGIDGGASGVAREAGPIEKEVNLTTALATRQYLRGLGATVVMTRDSDEKFELDEILAFFRDPAIDLSISMHSNSIFSGDGAVPSGVETFYYEEGSRGLAEQVQAAVVAATGRKNREAKSGYYKVTLNSLAPTVMLEMGFLTNPLEYDDLCSDEGIYAMAEAIGNGVIATLSPPAEPEADAESGAEE